jgi:hypothetical protein
MGKAIIEFGQYTCDGKTVNRKDLDFRWIKRYVATPPGTGVLKDTLWEACKGAGQKSHL